MSPDPLTFTTANWNSSQTVTIAGVDDFLDDGDVAFMIITAAATSADANYNAINASDVSVTNIDDDTAGITVDPTEGLFVTEAGGTATFTVVLTSQPGDDVTSALSSSDMAEGIVSPDSITFTIDNWSSPRIVTITGVDDLDPEPEVDFVITTSAVNSMDPAYNGMDVEQRAGYQH